MAAKWMTFPRGVLGPRIGTTLFAKLGLSLAGVSSFGCRLIQELQRLFTVRRYRRARLKVHISAECVAQGIAL